MGALVSGGWCGRLPGLLQLSDHESREHVMVAMTTMARSCLATFQPEIKALEALKEEYVKLAEAEADGDDDDSYFMTLVTQTQNLINALTEPPSKDEKTVGDDSHSSFKTEASNVKKEEL